MLIGELIDRLWIPLAVAIVLVGAQAAYLIRRSIRLDRSEERFGAQPAARARIRESWRILLRATIRVAGIVALLFASVYLLSIL